MHLNTAYWFIESTKQLGIRLSNGLALQQAQQFWDHVAYSPGSKDPIANSCFLRGKAGTPKGKGFSKTIHYELSSMARINYQYCDEYQTSPQGDKHHVVFILSIDYSSH